MSRKIVILCLASLLILVSIATSVFVEESKAATEITFQYIGGTVPNVDGVINEAIDKFQQENPGITVKTIYVDWGNAHSQFMNSIMAGMAPDIGMLAGTWAVEFVETGALADIEKYVSKGLIDSFIPSGFSAMTGTDGKKYGLPWDGCTWGLFYRTDLFEKAGLTQPPKTWEELVEFGKKLTNEKTSGLVFPAAGWEPDDYFLPFLWQAGANVCEFKDGKWVGTFDKPEAKVAVQYYYDLVNKHKITPKTITGMDWEACKNTFVAGDAAMMVNGMWVIGAIKGSNPELDGKWATAMMPAGPGGIAALSYPNTMHITQQSKNKEAAGKFLDFFYSKGYYDKFCIQSGVFAFTKDFAKSDYAQDKLLKPFVELAQYGKNRPSAPKYEQFRQLFFNAAIQKLIANNITPDDFCEQMNKAFNDVHK
jgi:multiple sugar transport system substrate-binding protein